MIRSTERAAGNPLVSPRTSERQNELEAADAEWFGILSI
jgi:hypothetical protein